MSDRTHIGLDNPAFRGRLRQPQGSAQLPRLSSVRPSARYYNEFTSAAVGNPKPISSPPQDIATSTTLQIASPSPVATAQRVPAVAVSKPAFTPLAVQNSAEPSQAAVPIAVAAEPKSLAQRRHRSPAFGKNPATRVPVTQQPKPLPFDVHKPQRSQVLSRHTLYEQTLQSEPEIQTPIENALAVKSRKKRALFHPHLRLKGYTKLQYGLVTMAVVVFAVGIGVSVMTLQTNKLTTQKVAAIAKQSTKTSATSAPGAAAPGTPPSTIPPSARAVSSYAVGPNMPKYLNIPKFGVHARVLSLSILNSGALATPNNVFDTGWYNESSLPGQPGAMLFDGHVSSWTTKGVFYHIKDLVGGDVIQVVRGDDTVFNYQVVKNQFFDHDDVDMQSSVEPVYKDKPGLNLITCTGDVIKGSNEFNERVIVYASLQ